MNANESKSLSARRLVPSAFTLIELLTVIAIIGILAAILIPVVSSVRDSARAAKCTSNVRQTGLLKLAMAEDNNWNLVSQVEGTGSRMWPQLLSTGGYQSFGEREILYCPSVPAPPSAFSGQGAWHWQTYGMFMIPNFPASGIGAYTTVSGGFGQPGIPMFVLNANSVSDPSLQPVLSDSIRLSDRSQVFRIRDRDGNNNEGVRLTHGNRANIFFLDGHVEGADKARLAQLGMRAAYTAEGQRVTFDATTP